MTVVPNRPEPEIRYGREGMYWTADGRISTYRRSDWPPDYSDGGRLPRMEPGDLWCDLSLRDQWRMNMHNGDLPSVMLPEDLGMEPEATFPGACPKCDVIVSPTDSYVIIGQGDDRKWHLDCAWPPKVQPDGSKVYSGSDRTPAAPVRRRTIWPLGLALGIICFVSLLLIRA